VLHGRPLICCTNTFSDFRSRVSRSRQPHRPLPPVAFGFRFAVSPCCSHGTVLPSVVNRLAGDLMVGVEQCFLQQVPHMPTLEPVQNSPSLPGALDETSKAELGKVLTGDRRPAATAANVATSDSPWRNAHRIRSLVGSASMENDATAAFTCATEGSSG